MKKRATKASRRFDPLDVALGARIREVRMAQVPHLSQQWLAMECGISFQQVQKYETGHDRVAWSRLCVIANALGISVLDLVTPLFKDVHSSEP